MARAATKRNQGTRQAPGAATPDQKRARKKAEKSLEDELFFNRLRGHAKWVFVLLAIVFGFSFVFLGVGTGAGGLSDVFNSLVGHSSGTSVESLQKKVAENPGSRAAVVDLASALQREGRVDEAIAAYQTFLDERPKDGTALANLAILYQTVAGNAATDVNNALRRMSLAAPEAQFRPGSGVLGDALGSFVDPIGQAASTNAEQAYQAALARYQAANKQALVVLKNLAKLSPNDSSALLRYAQAAEGANQPKVALAAYRQFVKQFPDDALVPDARARIRALEKQASAIQIPTPGDQTSP